MQSHPATAQSSAATTLRRAAPRDAEAVRALLITTWHSAYDHIMGEVAVTKACDGMFTLPQIQAMIAARGAIFQGVLEQADSLVGFLSIEVGPFGRTKLHMLYVHPEFQGRGIGPSFLDYAPEIFPWAYAMKLDVLESNVSAIRVYERCGFRRIGKPHSMKFATVPVVSMQRDLGRRIPWYKALLRYADQLTK
jgi:ribosomal protein S18 acetylase RimI-like enzyme